MNKKFLSAILFGALMASSTGTFVSCKDYDDDIDNLQGQIDSNKDAIAALQKLVGEGKWVSAITPVENGFTVTMSDGSTQTVTSGKGQDGKDGTEWTIGEDGFWYKDGEKTENQAIGQNGATAPSPQINADGYWVLYEWDETTGEFVEKVTEIPAQGTGAYYVEKDGIIYLHIADQTGKFAEITLPATSDAFVVEAPAALVKVNYNYAKWKPSTTNKDYKALLEEFPAIGEIEENTIVKQGGNLPLLVTPANVDLTEGFTFSLQDVKGKTANIVLSNPVKGLPTNADIEGSTMETGSADASACFWTLKADPQIEEKQPVVVDKTASLVAENAKGTVVKTAFAYQISKKAWSNNNVEINPNDNEDGETITTGVASYASEIDLLAYDETKKAYPIYLKYAYNNYFIITPANEYEIEKYGLSVEGQTLKIANMPSDVNEIEVTLNVIALGLNGSATHKEVNLKIGQEVAATGNLKDQIVALTGEKQTIKWNITELGLSAVELDKVLSAGLNMSVTREYYNDNDQEVKAFTYNDKVKFYDASGNETTYNSENHKWNGKEGVTFGIEFNASSEKTNHNAPTGYVAEQWTAADYTVKLTSSTGTAPVVVIYSAEATLTTTLPSAMSEYIKLAPAFVENGILQVTGTSDGTNVTYDLKDALVLKNVKVKEIIDLDYDKETVGDNLYSSFNWMSGIANEDGYATLSVNTWKEEDEDGFIEAKDQQLYKTRNIRAKVYFFENEANEADFDFQLVVKSTIFSDKPADVVTFKADKLVSVYGGNAIKVKEAVKEAIYTAGPKRGTAYNLFGTDAGNKNVTDYKSAENDSTYILTATKAPIQIETADLTKFGMSASDFVQLKNTDRFYLQLAEYSATSVNNLMSSEIIGWRTIVNAVDGNIYDYVNGVYKQIKPDNQLNSQEKIYKELFDKYSPKINYTVTKSIEVSATPVGDGVDVVTLKFADADEAAKYVTTSNVETSFEVKPLAPTELTVDPKNVEIPMYLVVKDKWGKTMNVPFNITVKTTAE